MALFAGFEFSLFVQTLRDFAEVFSLIPDQQRSKQLRHESQSHDARGSNDPNYRKLPHALGSSTDEITEAESDDGFQRLNKPNLAGHYLEIDSRRRSKMWDFRKIQPKPKGLVQLCRVTLIQKLATRSRKEPSKLIIKQAAI